MNITARVMHPFLDLLFPRSCEGCGSSLGEKDGRYVCRDCLADRMVIQPPFCMVCGQPVEGFVDHEYVCSDCTRKRPNYDQARSCVMYDGMIRELLLTFKYGDGIWLANDLAHIMAVALGVYFDPQAVDGFISVPLFHRKRRERGYNQAAILSGVLSKSFCKPLFCRFLRRIHMTGTQTKLTASQRQINVRGAFKAKRTTWLEGRRLVLVDDVMTTGATVNECARVLKDAGAARVDVLTLARGVI